MGWTGLRRVPGAMTDAEFFAREFGLEIKASTTKRGVFYGVVEMEAAKDERLVPDESGKVRTAIIVLMKRGNRDGYNFRYKEMSEFMGPCETGCPAKLLNMLSPLTVTEGSCDWAAEWRRKCREAAA